MLLLEVKSDYFVPESFLVDLNCAPWSVIDCFEDVDDKLK